MSHNSCYVANRSKKRQGRCPTRCTSPPHFYQGSSEEGKYLNSLVLRRERGGNSSEITWMALEMFPLYVKTNQADGENYYWLRGVECGGGSVDRKGR